VQDLIDRADEARLLRGAAAEPPSLVILTGRRRVGKSFLLASVLAGDRVVSVQADEQDEGGHLELVSREAARLLPGSPPLRFDSWDAALAYFETQAEDAPLVVILDEFQYLCASQPALPSMIQRRWDRWQRTSLPVTLVLCGSALSFMEGLLDASAPLHGRATARPLLTPLDFRDAAAFARTRDPEELLRRYAVLGGTPQYQAGAGAGPLGDIIERSILTKGQPLYEDPLHVLRQGEGVRDPGTYFSILRVIAAGATRHNEIATRAGVGTANLSGRLDRLQDLGYVAPWSPLGADGRERRSSYRIADPYFRFFFRYVFPNRSRLERGRVAEVAAEIEADFDNVMGRAFEDACRHWVGVYAPEARVGRIEELGSWWSRDGQVEIDLVGVGKHRYRFLGSSKWRRTVGARELATLREARATLGGSAATARLALFARDGFDERVVERAEEEDVLLVTARDLFA
jgi:hypothetical protein